MWFAGIGNNNDKNKMREGNNNIKLSTTVMTFTQMSYGLSVDSYLRLLFFFLHQGIFLFSGKRHPPVLCYDFREENQDS